MNFNFLVFPSPKCTYSPKILGKQLIFIPKFDTGQESFGHLPKLIDQPYPPKIKEIQLITKKTSNPSKVDSANFKDDLSEREFSLFFQKTLESCEHIDSNEEFSEENQCSYEHPKVSINNYSEMYTKKIFCAVPENQIRLRATTEEFNRDNNCDWYFPKIMNEPRKKKISCYIPCLLFNSILTNKIMIYFHGNAEDIFNSYTFLNDLHQYLGIRVISIEYPGYGLYKTHKSSAERIEQDALYVYDYLTKYVGFRDEDIIVFGRSIGSGPSIYIAANRNPRALIVLSGFKSLRSVVKQHLGSLDRLVKERFNNIENIKKCNCPVLFMHGERDGLISTEHAISLKENCRGPSEIYLSNSMTHSEFYLESDCIAPIQSFFIKYGLYEHFQLKNEIPIKFPPIVFDVPQPFSLN